MRRLIIQPAAARDLREHADYLSQRSLKSPLRFADAVDASFQTLSEMPEIGGVREFKRSKLTGIRAWPIRGFENYVIFYRLVAEDLVIVRVLHGARDADRIFEHEEGA